MLLFNDKSGSDSVLECLFISVLFSLQRKDRAKANLEPCVLRETSQIGTTADAQFVSIYKAEQKERILFFNRQQCWAASTKAEKLQNMYKRNCKENPIIPTYFLQTWILSIH